MLELTPQGRNTLIDVAKWLEAGAPHIKLPNELEIDTFDMEMPVDVNPSCGTSCCIAGAVCQFAGLGLDHRDEDGALDWMGLTGARELAGDYLGMPGTDQYTMFEPWNHFCGDSESFNAPARGAAVIRHYLATGEVDWDAFHDDGSVHE